MAGLEGSPDVVKGADLVVLAELRVQTQQRAQAVRWLRDGILDVLEAHLSRGRRPSAHLARIVICWPPPREGEEPENMVRSSK
eukprot:4770203-Prymnesium_polylepis.1